MTSNLDSAIPTFTYDQIADQLTTGYWRATSRDERRFDVDVGGTLTVNISALTAAGQSLALTALSAWSAVTGLTFQQTTDLGDIRFDDNQSGAYANYSVTGNVINYSWINVSTSWINYYGTNEDSYSLQTYIHEIGHALGLGHAGNYNGSASYPNDALYTNDSWQASIMSYFSQTENTSIDATRAFVMTPMIADIIAMRSLYGTTSTFLATDTIFGLNSTAGGIYDFFAAGTPNNITSVTIIDDGGNDLIDYSHVNADQNFNLNDESISDVAGYVGNLSIARDTIIENVRAGSGDDTIIGNEVNNLITGNGGNDIIDGAAGEDTAIFSGNFSEYTITQTPEGSYIVAHTGGTQQDETDTLTNVENLSFADRTIAVTDLPITDNLLVNGSFEMPNLAAGEWTHLTEIAGWKAISGGEIEIWNGVNGVVAPEGTQHAELDYTTGVDGFYQDVETVSGQTYNLSLEASARPGSAASTQGVQIFWNGVLVGEFAPNVDWTTHTFDVVGTGGNDRLMVRELASQDDGFGALLDNFSLVADGLPNTAPVAVDDDLGIYTENLYSVSVPPSYLTDNDTDADGDTLTVSAVSETTEAGSSVSISESGSVTYLTNNAFDYLAEGESVTDTFTYTIDDGRGGTDTATVSLEIGGINDAPIVSVPIQDQDAIENTAFSFTLPADAFTDVDASDVLTYTATLEDDSALPSWLTFDGTTFTGTPPDGAEGVINVKVTASDGRANVSDIFELSISNDAPPPTNLLVNGSFEDPDLAAGEWTHLTEIAGWKAISGGEIEIWNGVNGVVAPEGTQHAELDYTTGVDGFYQDVETVSGQTYNLSLEASARPGSAASTQGVQIFWNGVLVGEFAPNVDWTTHTFDVVGTGGNDRLMVRELASQDDGFGALLDNFSLVADSVPAPNSAPIAVDDDLTTLSIPQSTTVRFQDSRFTSNDTDVDGDTLTMTSVSATSAAGAVVSYNTLDGLVSYSTNGKFSYLAEDEETTDTFTYTVSDGQGGTDTATATVKIVGANDAPIVANEIADQETDAYQSFNFTLPADVFSDPDTSDVLQITASDLTVPTTATLADGAALPAWLSFDGETFSGTPTNADSGTLFIQVTASDGITSVSDVFELNVTLAPPAEPLGDNVSNPLILDEEDAFSFHADADVSQFISPTTGLTQTPQFDVSPAIELETMMAAFQEDQIDAPSNGVVGNTMDLTTQFMFDHSEDLPDTLDIPAMDSFLY